MSFNKWLWSHKENRLQKRMEMGDQEARQYMVVQLT
jgi:hypothetical protein